MPDRSTADGDKHDLYSMKQQQLGQKVATFVLGGLHEKVTPFVEMLHSETVEELLRCPAAANGMTAPAIERDVMGIYDKQHRADDNRSDQAEQEPSHATTRDRDYAWSPLSIPCVTSLAAETIHQ